jgi:glucose-1-phosphate cytidylyltransferase
MKVVLFCGGLGMRLREYSDAVPKPLVKVGYRPILWHLMRYYAHFGHKDFILCLGYRGDAIKQYFLNYDETTSNDFKLVGRGKQVQLLASDIDDWNITFVDTGLTSNIAQRLQAVEPHLAGEEMFLANYADGLTDLPLPEMTEYFQRRDAVACFVAVAPKTTFHLVRVAEDGRVDSINHIKDVGMRVNGGFFVFRNEIFRHIGDEEELVEAPFQRLAAAGRLVAYPYDGFWGCMDTFKERQMFEDMYARGASPWEVWKAKDRAGGPRGR